MDQNADSQEIRSYLLGELDGGTHWEEKLSAPETHEEFLIVEEELIDQYVAGGLSALERQQFETNFLITPERQKNLRFGQLLNRYVNSHRLPMAPKNPAAAAATPHVGKIAPAKKSFSFSLSSPAGLRAMALSLIAVALIGLVLLWALALRPPARPVQHLDEPALTVTRLRGSTTDEGTTPQRVNVPPKGSRLKLELELANAKFRNYKSELFRENHSVQTDGELRVEMNGDQFVIPVTITGDRLSPGDYQLKLSGVLDSGVDEFIEQYSFRVIE